MYSIDWSDNIWPRYNYLKICRNKSETKIAFKSVHIKFLGMHITNQTFRFDIFTVIHLYSIERLFAVEMRHK